MSFKRDAFSNLYQSFKHLNQRKDLLIATLVLSQYEYYSRWLVLVAGIAGEPITHRSSAI